MLSVVAEGGRALLYSATNEAHIEGATNEV